MRIQSIARAAAILREFSAETPVLGVAELSRRLDLDRSTVQRLVSSLADAGLLDQDPISKKHRLGLGLLELSGTMVKCRGFPHIVRPYLRHLTDLVGESTYLGVLDRASVLEIEEIPGPYMIQHSGWTGRRLPLHCSASGKALLAGMAPEEAEGLIARLDLQPLTGRAITDRDDLRREIVEVRERGYATCFGEFDQGTNALAAALSLPGKMTQGAVCIVGPSIRFTESKALECVDSLWAVCREISEKFAQAFA
jgi:IclR family KDG regulon transcriptional repressor